MKKIFFALSVLIATFITTSCLYIDANDLWGGVNAAYWTDNSCQEIKITFDACTTVRKDVSLDFKNSSGISMRSLERYRDTRYNEIIVYLETPLRQGEKVKITWNDAYYSTYLYGHR